MRKCTLRELASRLADTLDRIEARMGSAPPVNDSPLSLAEAAERLGCTQSHLRRMIAAGSLKAIRLGTRKLVKIPSAELARLLAGESIADSNSAPRDSEFPDRRR